LTGSPGCLGQFFFKSKRRRFSKKKNKSQRVATGFLTGSCQVNRVTPGFSFPYFFLQPGPIPAPGRPGPGSTHLAGPDFKTMHFTVKLVEQAKEILLTSQHFTNKKLIKDQFISFKIWLSSTKQPKQKAISLFSVSM
jgi:hypothetical protein